MTTSPELEGQSPKTKTEKEPSGAWLRLPCCDHAVHPVRVLEHQEGVMVVSAPRAPHEEWVERPSKPTTVVLGWTDHHGSTVLECRVVPETHMRESDEWALEVLAAADFVQRRKHRRVRTELKAHLLDEHANEPVQAQMLDISEGGMRCSFTDYVPQERGMPLKFAINIDGTVVLMLAKMRWTGRVSPVELHAGFEFNDTPEAVVTRIRAHVIKQLDRV